MTERHRRVTNSARVSCPAEVSSPAASTVDGETWTGAGVTPAGGGPFLNPDAADALIDAVLGWSEGDRADREWNERLLLDAVEQYRCRSREVRNLTSAKRYWCWKHSAYGEGTCPICSERNEWTRRTDQRIDEESADPENARCAAATEQVRSSDPDIDTFQDDLAAILRAVVLSDAARPYSAHEVVQRDLLPRLVQIDALLVLLGRAYRNDLGWHRDVMELMHSLGREF